MEMPDTQEDHPVVTEETPEELPEVDKTEELPIVEEEPKTEE
jgi:hypothetical protein